MKKFYTIILLLFSILDVYANSSLTREFTGFYISEHFTTCAMFYGYDDYSSTDVNHSDIVSSSMSRPTNMNFGLVSNTKLAWSFDSIVSTGAKIDFSIVKEPFVTMYSFIKINFSCPIYLEVGVGGYFSIVSNEISFTIYESLGYQWISMISKNLQYYMELNVTLLPVHIARASFDSPEFLGYCGISIGVKYIF